MASIQLDSASKLYRIRFGGKAYFRSLNTPLEAEADTRPGRAESTINAITQGFLSIAPGTDQADFTQGLWDSHSSPASSLASSSRATGGSNTGALNSASDATSNTPPATGW